MDVFCREFYFKQLLRYTFFTKTHPSRENRKKPVWGTIKFTGEICGEGGQHAEDSLEYRLGGRSEHIHKNKIWSQLYPTKSLICLDYTLTRIHLETHFYSIQTNTYTYIEKSTVARIHNQTHSYTYTIILLFIVSFGLTLIRTHIYILAHSHTIYIYAVTQTYTWIHFPIDIYTHSLSLSLSHTHTPLHIFLTSPNLNFLTHFTGKGGPSIFKWCEV